MPKKIFDLNIVFPADSDTFKFDEIRYAGSTQPGTKMRVQGKRSRVYKSGAFVGVVKLAVGWNDLVFEARANGESIAKTVRIFRKTEPELPSHPTRIDMERGALPSDIYLSVGYIGITSDSINSVFKRIDGTALLSLPAGIRMRIVGEMDGFKKVQLAQDTFGYVLSSQLRALPAGESLLPARFGELTISEYTDWVQARVRLSERVPYKIKQTSQPGMLEVTFYNVIGEPKLSQHFWSPITALSWQQDEERGVLRIMLNQPQQWGYWGNFFGNSFLLNIRKTPTRRPERGLLAGLKVTVDAGHGGKFEGAVGSTGLTEKSVNFKIAKMTAEFLRQQGAIVSLTLARDTTLTLPARIEVARKSNTHIFLSIHNNSIAPNSHPLKPRGISAFYTSPQSRDLAIKIYRELLGLKLKPFGYRRSDYFVTRQTDMLSVLIEGAFLTHPLDEMLLLDDAFLRRMAQAIAHGVLLFADEQLQLRSRPSPREFETPR